MFEFTSLHGFGLGTLSSDRFQECLDHLVAPKQLQARDRDTGRKNKSRQRTVPKRSSVR